MVAGSIITFLLTVKGFPQKKLGDVDDGLAKRSGVICIGDCIVAIDGESVLDLTFLQTMNRLRNIQDKSHTLTFRSSEHLKNLSQHTANSPFGELNETRKMIHREKEKWYLSPQTDDMCYCYVERTRGVNSTSFNLYREDTGEFMLAATINKNMWGTVLFSNMKESYLRKIDDIVASEDSSSYLGCMTTNFLGDEFTIHDHRADPKKCESKDNKIHHELGLIRFEKNILGRVPNFMTVVVPRPEAEDERSESRRVQNRRISDRFERKYMERKELNVGDHIVNWFLNPFRSKEEKERIRAMSGGNANSGNRPRKGTFDEKEDTFGGGVQTPGYGGLEEDDNQDLLIMNTKKPSWNKRLNAWTLNFSGRVKKASKKNFLLIAKQDNHSFESNISDVKDDRAEDKTDIDNEESGATVYVRFGKFTKHRFVLDFSAPMSSIVALGIAVSCFTKKLTVT